MSFEDLLEANRQYAESFSLQGFDGIARRGVCVVTCMDSRLDPLGMMGLTPGDAKILRNPGGRVTDRALVAIVLGVSMLNVDRVAVVQHTRCAMAAGTEQELRARIAEVAGVPANWLDIGVIDDHESSLAEDVLRVKSHPLVPSSVEAGGFLYDVDTGLLRQVA